MVDSEIMKRATLLVNSKGKDALKHANQMFEGVQETGDEDDLVYWQRIVMQVELLVEGNNPDKNSPL